MQTFGQLRKLEQDDIWTLTIKGVPNDARISYQYFVSKKDLTLIQSLVPDPYNELKIDGQHGDPQYIAEMPHALPQTHILRPTLVTTMSTIQSEGRLKERQIDFSHSPILFKKKPT